MLEKKNDALIAAKAVLARYGGICGMTLHRWVRRPDLNFPKRLLITHSRKQIRQIANSIERFVAVRRGLCVSG
jgi:hypothetical protein